MTSLCPSNLIEEGLSHQKAGRLEEAAKNYRQVLAEDPHQPDALHLLGVIAQNVGELDEAVELIAESLRFNPNNVAAINNLAGVLKDQRRYEDSVEFYLAALEAAPDAAYIHSNLGNVLKEMGRLADAETSFRRAILLDPKSYIAHNNLGTIFEAQGRPTEAIAYYRQALDLNPKSHEAFCNLGVVLKDQGKFAEAQRCFEQALQLHPGLDAACTNLGSALKEQGRLNEAVAVLLRALEINPHSHLALNNLGNTLKEQGKFTEAVTCFQRSLKLEPESHLAHNNLGSALNELGRSDEALDCFRRALEIKSTFHPALSNLLFTLNYQPNVDRAELFAQHRRFDTEFGQKYRDVITLHTNDRNPERKLRVGFVSGDFREHPVANFIEPVFTSHSKENFEIFCYANQHVSDSTTARLESKVEHWRAVGGLTDDELADQIRRDRIDILVDLSGHTSKNRLLVFARKPAPIQVTMIGYMQTSGLSAMDYRITEERLDPIGTSEEYNTEKLVRMIYGAAPFQPPVDAPLPNELPALKNGYITFASFNNLAKVTPEAVDAWARILHALPTAKLLLVGRAGNTLIEDFEAHGLTSERIIFQSRLPLKEFMALHHQVDFLLDTFPYNGGTTSLLAAWMGVPLITLAGETTAGRAGAGLLTVLGLPELISTDADDYFRKAVAAASDLPKLAQTRAALRDRLAPLLGGGVGFTNELEGAFRDMWRTWCAGQA